MKRSNSRLATIVGVTVLCFAAATTASSGVTSAADPECTQWDLNGEWKFVQTNETSPVFKLQQTPTGLQGSADYRYLHESECIFLVSCADEYFHVGGSVDGTVKGSLFEVTAYWTNGTTGVYTGTINAQGRIEGSTYDKQHPQVQARWHSEPTAKCLTSTTGSGERTGTTSSGLSTPAAPVAVRPQGRVKLGGVVTKSTLTKCEAAKQARARNSPAAPGLEAQCKAEQASGVSAVATAGNDRRRVPPGESPTVTKTERFGAGGPAWLAFVASQPENTIKVRVRYKKEYGYEGDTNAFGYVGPTSCNTFSISLHIGDGSVRLRNLIRVSSDGRMDDAGGYYMCSYLASDIPVGQPMSVSVSVSSSHLTEAWKGGNSAQPPEGQQRAIVGGTQTAVLDPAQPRARLSYEMVYAPVVAR